MNKQSQQHIDITDELDPYEVEVLSYEMQVMEHLLVRYEYNIARIARHLGSARGTVYARLQRLFKGKYNAESLAVYRQVIKHKKVLEDSCDKRRANHDM